MSSHVERNEQQAGGTENPVTQPALRYRPLQSMHMTYKLLWPRSSSIGRGPHPLAAPLLQTVQYEQRVVDIVLETKNLPETLAMTGALEIRCAGTTHSG